MRPSSSLPTSTVPNGTLPTNTAPTNTVHQHRLRRRLTAFAAHTGNDARHLANVLRDNTTGGLIMLGATLVALLWANLSPASYQALADFHIGTMTVAHWASDGLLTIFFFVAGLELKREFTEGSLRRPKDALVPIFAAAAGMLFPACTYLLVNWLVPKLGGAAGHPEGWAIPMATDIAFVLAVLAVVGSDLPTSMRAFLLTLAIVDDLGAIIVIAVVFTADLNWLWLLGAVAGIVCWGLLQRAHLKPDWRNNGWWYLPLGVLTWWCMLQSGVHATIAGVALGLLTRNTRESNDDPLDRWQHRIEPWSTGLVVPVFALFAAGVHMDAHLFGQLWVSAVPLGVMIGLFFGKLTGVLTGTWLTVRLTDARLGPGLHRGDTVAAAQLTGIGFTVSLLICELTFANNPDLMVEAKAAVLLASAAAALVGGLAMSIRSRKHRLSNARNTAARG